MKSNAFRFFIWILYGATLVLLLYFVFKGSTYYRLPLSERPRHAQYSLWKPGGTISHGLGIAGSTMLVLLLLYSLRKRTALFGSRGRMDRWLQVHIYFGLMGPLFIILHSTFKLNGLVAVSFWSMVTVAVSGVLGRFLYQHIPRNIQGQELSLKEVEEMRRGLQDNLKKQFALQEAHLQKIERLLENNPGRRDSFTGLLLVEGRLLFTGRSIKKRLMENLPVSDKDVHRLYKIARRKTILERRIRLWERIHRMFHYWHVFHKPFAIIMYIIMFIHVAISVWLGYTWVF